jgi:hypothetical protein
MLHDPGHGTTSVGGTSQQEVTRIGPFDAPPNIKQRDQIGDFEFTRKCTAAGHLNSSWQRRGCVIVDIDTRSQRLYILPSC